MVSTVRIKQITDFFFFFGLSWKNILQQIKKLVELVLPSFYFQSIWLTNSCPLTVYPARCWPFREVKRSWPSPEGVDGWKVFHLTIIYLNKQTKKKQTKTKQIFSRMTEFSWRDLPFFSDPRSIHGSACESLSVSLGCDFWGCGEQVQDGPMIQCYSKERRSLVATGIFQSRKTTRSVQRLSQTVLKDLATFPP